MFFQNEQVIFWSLGATKSQLMSWFLGLLLCTKSWIWSTQCFKISFQGSPPGHRPHISSLVSRASDCTLGSMIPRSPHDRGSMRESHLTFAQVLDTLLPQMKFRTTPLTWLHILGLGFQQGTMYHMDESKTWLAIRILLTRERMQLSHAIILPFKEVMSLSKFASTRSQKPTWMPK